ncbi:helix-turn-helix domain-containing protein [Streptomyces bacillaris]|uniref:helix-turn-helix domain-containing protein n=1 Tax=Streptomyces bacillaris TaxID=68179 RepID=UPI00381C11DA
MTAEKPRPRPATQYGETAKSVAQNVLRLRKRRDMSIYQLSAALRAAGRPITPAAVGKIEREQRQVTVDDLAALAVIFGVSPGALLLPPTDSPAASIGVTGAGQVVAADAWEWAEGRRPLKSTGRAEQMESLEYLLNSVPPEQRRFRQHPVGRALEAVTDDVKVMHARLRFHLFSHPERAERLAERTRQAVARLAAEVERLAGDLADGADQQVEGGRDGAGLD